MKKIFDKLRNFELKFRDTLAKNYYSVFIQLIVYGAIVGGSVFFILVRANDIEFVSFKATVTLLLSVSMMFSMLVLGGYVESKIVKKLERYGAVEQYNLLKTSNKANVVLLVGYTPFFVCLGLQFIGLSKQVFEAILLSSFCFTVFVFPFVINTLKSKQSMKTISGIIKKLDELERQNKIKLIDVWNLIIKEIGLNCKTLFRRYLGIKLENNSKLYDSFRVSTLAYIIGDKEQKRKARKWIENFSATLLNDKLTNNEKIPIILKHVEHHQDDEDYTLFLEMAKKHELNQSYDSIWQKISQRFGKNEAIITFAISTLIGIIALLK